jgi:hypothetical protein
MLQGGFLFAFDVVTYLAHQSGNHELREILQGVRFNGQELGLLIQF